MTKDGGGDRFAVIPDYPLAAGNVARWAEAEGHAVEVEQKETEWEIRITMRREN